MNPIAAARALTRKVEGLRFGPPVAWVYNPLRYARAAHEAYLERYGQAPKRVLLLGMNPGPWGMAQPGIPFGEVEAVRGWLGLEVEVGRPPREHPRRPVLGLACARSEVSGRRLWGLLRERFGTAEAFFRSHFVANYCPLLFLGENGENLTPDKLPAAEREPLLAACDEHLARLLAWFRPEWAVGVGRFAENRLREVCAQAERGAGEGRVPGRRPAAVPRVAGIPHPSPASPAANRGWAAEVTRRLREAGVWE